jgi:pyruvate kinase
MKNEDNYKRVKIVATLGPATRSLDMIEKLYLTGVNVFRLNFSHSEYHEHKESYDNVRAVSKKYAANIGVFADLQGPKLRVGKFKEGKATLLVGQKFILDFKDELGDDKRVKLPHPEIFEALKEKDSLLIDDGKIRLVVDRCGPDFAETTVAVGGIISNSKGVNYPSGILKLSALTPKDLKDLDFALSLGVDYIALSFVQLPIDVEQARDIIKGRAKIISKIEKPSALEYIDEIIKVSDAIMVARGDLGVEIPAEKVPVAQKNIIRICRKYNKPVIVATQMLDSMTNMPIPTRAEASDVANAVFDGADAVMLSGETTVGLYPIETVQTMSNIIKQVEQDPYYWDNLDSSYEKIISSSVSNTTTGMAIMHATKKIENLLNIKVIVAYSSKGVTINRISHQKPKAKILGITDNSNLVDQLALNWGVQPLLIEKVRSFSEVADFASDWLKKNNWVVEGDKIILIASIPINEGGSTNSLRIIEI